MVIEIKELDREECKIKRVLRMIRNNGRLNNIEVERGNLNNKKIEYDFGVMKSTWCGRHLSLIPYTVQFWGILDTETMTMRIGNVEEHLFDKILNASKLLFGDIEGLTVVIEKDYC